MPSWLVFHIPSQITRDGLQWNLMNVALSHESPNARLKQIKSGKTGDLN
jgi:hypothetical protein